MQTVLLAFKEEAAPIDEVMRAELSGVADAELREILDYALFNGGKRIRPLLVILMARLASLAQEGEMPEPRTLSRLATVFEYLHVASLLHDDVIDNAADRRGRPVANSVWGVHLAILAGDWLHARAMTIAGTLGSAAVTEVIGQATEAMIAAEFLQRRLAETGDSSPSRYFEVLQGKTAALIAAACETGIIATDWTEEVSRAPGKAQERPAGAGMDRRRLAIRYGGNLGIAFQIVDDLLDYLGDPAKTGKGVGNDFQEGKMTLPLIMALAHGDQETGEKLRTLMEKAGKTAPGPHHDFAEASRLIASAGGFTKAREKAVYYIEDAKDALTHFPACREKELLTALADYVLSRDK